MGQTPSPQDPMPTPRAGQAWPDGWYVYEAGRLNGPFTAAETFNREPEPDTGKPLLVSRKGFSQWYPLRDLSEIYRASEGAAVPAAPSARPKVMAKKIGLNAAPHFTAPAAARPVAASPARVAPVSAQRPLSSPSVSAFKSAVSASSDTSVSASHAKKAVLQEYFLARTRLRLGKIRNPWTTALVGFPVFWPIWFVAVQKEMMFHTHTVADAKKVQPWTAVLAMIPFVHMFMAFQLAKSVRSMEAQNKYRYTRPWVAASLAIFPPFAMGYLQYAMNRHWMLHAKHLVVKRRAKAA